MVTKRLVKKAAVVLLSASGLALLLILIRNIGFREIQHAVGFIHRWQALAIMSFPLLSFAIASLRWKFIIRSAHGDASFLKLLSWEFMGQSVSLIAPSFTVSGQAAKGLLFKKSGVASAVAFGSVGFDAFVRLIAILALTFVLLAIVLIEGADSVQALEALWLVALGCIAALFLWGFLRRGGRISGLLFKFLKLRSGTREEIHELDKILERLLRSRRLVAIAFLISAIGFLWEIAQVAIVLHFLGLPLRALSSIGVYLGMAISGVIPVPAGIGFKEAGGTFAGAHLGIGGLYGLTAILLLRLRDLSTLLAGGILFLRERLRV